MGLGFNFKLSLFMIQPLFKNFFWPIHPVLLRNYSIIPSFCLLDFLHVLRVNLIFHRDLIAVWLVSHLKIICLNYILSYLRISHNPGISFFTQNNQSRNSIHIELLTFLLHPRLWRAKIIRQPGHCLEPKTEHQFILI